MTEKEKAEALIIALERAIDDGDLFFNISGVSEDEVYEFLSNKVSQLEKFLDNPIDNISCL